MSRLDPWYEAREEMVRALSADLMGTSEDVHLDEPPLDRFLVGVLHPPGEQPEVDVADVGEVETGTQVDADYDPGVSFSRMRRPASMGLTFGVDKSTTTQVVVAVTADRYVPQIGSPVADETLPQPTDGDVEDDARVVDRFVSTKPKLWNLGAQVDFSQAFDVVPGTVRVEVGDHLQVRVVVRPEARGITSVTVVLVNTHAGARSNSADEFCWFRPEISVETVGGAFVARRASSAAPRGSDEASADLLYRGALSLAAGHGCAVTWPSGTGPVQRLVTTFLPRQDLEMARPERPELAGRFGMRTLGSTDDRSALHDLVDGYEGWVDSQAARLGELPDQLRVTGEDHVAAAREAVERMRRGIRSLDADPDAARAFRVMNSSMQSQRARQVMVRTGADVPSEDEQHWRPFQVAFILLNLEGLVDPASPERDVADLLWFPTGGGKTEAYLGLIAFTLVLRRLRGLPGAGGGVGVIMRYTLRLLTLQQFERATGLMCALEVWRRQELPASTPFTVGLWVGLSATPNDKKQADAALRALADGRSTGKNGNPCQLLACPWCGHALRPADYVQSRTLQRLVAECPNTGCDFRDGLPVVVVDEDVYSTRPSLLIGTVDKFAMMAWREEVRQLFGQDGRFATPDLIVQDELHLISGPLGTLVGLYETAVDAAATGSARPKLVASTATIRRARDQVRAVFDRDSRQFPPSGIDPEDSWFAVQAPPDELPARLYVGVLAPGASHSTLLIRTYAALLQAGKDLQAAPEVRDAYWTLLGYFNSLRVLGAAYIQSIDDVPGRLPVVARRLGSQVRELREPKELTSRVPAEEVPQRLKELTTSVGGEDCQDVVLATNMISVGVDVDRLGLMVVMGQPQTTSEYIQATSRVGRRHPGLVITLYNAARTRDLSHYEAFVPYHRALYRQVEATGATPFAPRAVDRGLHGVLVSLMRLLVKGAAVDTAVRSVEDSDAVERVRRVVRERVAAVTPDEQERVLDALDALIENWRAYTPRLTKLTSWQGPMGALVVPAGGSPFAPREQQNQLEAFPVAEPAWPTLTSLRNVDATSSLYIRNRKLGDRAR
ncbi:helicase-related protein [Cellulomonas marina]|uniref:Helicase conserved C-terminal domain-containing protein n=1 Tax=Cellulomonas marina TaxID=988821 RepID=A0A1I0Y610_9CELL|nr:helicase-related protein [Cellulomonas marina]GIG29817.1 DNA helicase [Cellulomonas marina]SFB08721.1 Helicase conserved C-terminal domain-containing protein [Cellulomonas marina]